MAHTIRPASFFLFATILLQTSCTGGNDPKQHTVHDRAVMEAESFVASVQNKQMQWLPVHMDSDHGQGVKLIAQDSAAWSESGLPSLTYELNFINAGSYEIAVRAKQQAAFNLETQKTYLTFGEDGGDVEWMINSFDEQWRWHSHDSNGTRIIATVTTPGTHQFKIASTVSGITIDQVKISSISLQTDTSNEQGNTVKQADTSQSNTQTNSDTQTNTNPSVSISGDNVIGVGQPITLTANATDDGKPYGAIYYYWSKTGGPGQATFTDVQVATTRVTFNQPGRYELHANANDGELNSNASIAIQVLEQQLQEKPAEQQLTDNSKLTENWNQLHGHNTVTPRHEAGGVTVNGKLYMLGGRGIRPVEVFDPATNRWVKVADAPMEMHHFQPVAIDGKIYVVGAFTCCYPQEQIISSVYVFNTYTNQWSTAGQLPTNRQRGGAGAVVHNNKIYLLGGNTKGHNGGAVNWFDEFDPQTGRWTTLPNAPDARDHLTLAMVNDKLVVAGGRQTAQPFPFENTVSRTNVFDFRTGNWSNAANIPTQRAGTMTVSVGNEVIVIGGESALIAGSHHNVEAYDVYTGQWRTLQSLNTGRHGGAAAAVNGSVHVVSGNETRGGGAETIAHEVLN